MFDVGTQPVPRCPALGRMSRAERLRLLVNEVAAAGWLHCDRAEALQRLGNARVEERRAEVARAATLAERLLVAVGGRDGPLRRGARQGSRTRILFKNARQFSSRN